MSALWAGMHPKRLARPNARFSFVGDKRAKQLQRLAWDAGWWPERKRAGIMWLAPDGVDCVMVHGTPSDRRAYDNMRADFRARGLQL